ncbi:MAG: glutamate racemase [Candidatus Moraniibacteriota bacterium]|nr:MAG: glutamate racemase [Candidatus Moranbacteria bacterium]
MPSKREGPDFDDSNNRISPIGIFDSGFGGLCIVRGVASSLPEYDIVFLGDSARVPYGTRSLETVFEFTQQAVEFLFRKDCPLILLSCNTASSDALRRLQQNFLPHHFPDRNILGVLVPAAEEAARHTRNGRIGVLATPGTVASLAFEREIHKQDSRLQLFQVACPLLVPLIESGEADFPTTDAVLERYLEPLLKKGVDTIILGCTHYGILARRIRERVGKDITVLSEGEFLGEKLRDYLNRHPEYARAISRNGTRTFLTTDQTNRFQTLGSRFLGSAFESYRIKL